MVDKGPDSMGEETVDGFEGMTPDEVSETFEPDPKAMKKMTKIAQDSVKPKKPKVKKEAEPKVITIGFKLIEIQAKLKVPKDMKNDFANFNYRSAEKILEAVKPILASAKLLLVLNDDIVLVGERYYVRTIAALSDGVSTITVPGFAREPESKVKMDDAQVTGSSSSYARKRALEGMFLLNDNDDADATNDGKTAQAKAVPAKPTAPKDPKAISEKEIKELQPWLNAILKVDTIEQLDNLAGQIKTVAKTGKISTNKVYYLSGKIQRLRTELNSQSEVSVAIDDAVENMFPNEPVPEPAEVVIADMEDEHL